MAGLALTVSPVLCSLSFYGSYRLATAILHRWCLHIAANSHLRANFHGSVHERLDRYGTGLNYKVAWHQPVIMSTGDTITLASLIYSNLLAYFVAMHVLLGCLCVILCWRKASSSKYESKSVARSLVIRMLAWSAPKFVALLVFAAAASAFAQVAFRALQAMYATNYNDEFPLTRRTNFAQDHIGWSVSILFTFSVVLLAYRVLIYPTAKSKALLSLGRCTRCDYSLVGHAHSNCPECGLPLSNTAK
jgi:hypothetical protein